MLSALLTGSVHAAVADDAAAEFAAGYLWGTKAEDKRPYIVGCFETDKDLNDLVDGIMDDYSKGDVSSADKKWNDAAPKFKKAMSKCDDVKGEFKDLSDYSKNVDKKTIKARTQKYQAEIGQLGGEMVERWQTGVYFDAGMYDGQISQYMGLVPNPYPDMVFADDAQNPEAPAQFIAGWLYGVSTQAFNMQDAIVACYTRNDDLTAAYYDAQAAFVAGDSQTGYSKLNDAKQYYDAFFANCGTDVTDPLTQWSDNIDALAQIDDWDTISAQIYLDNKQILDDDLSYEVNSWNRGVFFDAGMFAGRYQLIFYEQAPAQIIDEMLSYI
jgi:hypothetical protein